MKIVTNVSLFQIYAVNSAGAGPKVPMRITMDIKGTYMSYLPMKCY